MKTPAIDFGESSISARARMAAALVRLAANRDPRARPIRKALRATVRGRWAPDEARWIDRIERRRLELWSESRPTAMPEFEPRAADGTGGFSMSGPPTSMGMAAVLMSLSPHWCRLLLRLVREHRPRSCLELGTGFGISAAYTGAALELNGAGELTTLEGSEEWAASAGEGFDTLGLARISQRVGPIERTLADEADRRAPLDFVFIDAEHEGEATLDHFYTLLPHLSDGAILLFDDVGWPGVERAVEEIASDDRISTGSRIGRLAGCAVRGPRT